MRLRRVRPLLVLLAPGMITAATGVGAGDLATGSLTGSRLGLAVLWAVCVGALLKLVLTEGLARWQLATGETFLEGVVGHAGPLVGWLFLPYLLLWSFFVGSALASACGVTAHAIFPLLSPENDKIIYRVGGSAAERAGHDLALASRVTVVSMVWMAEDRSGVDSA